MNRNGNSGSTAESGPTYQQLAYDFVKARIMNLELKPGQYITDSQVAGDLNIIRGVNDQWYRVRIGLQALEGRMQRSTPEHERIVESILAGNGEEAARLNRTHVNSVRYELVRVLVNLVLPFAEEGV